MDKLKSRKFWVAIIAGAIVVGAGELGFDLEQESVVAFTAIVIAYLTGQSFVDRQKAKTSTDRAAPLIREPGKAEPNTDELHQG